MHLNENSEKAEKKVEVEGFIQTLLLWLFIKKLSNNYKY